MSLPKAVQRQLEEAERLAGQELEVPMAPVNPPIKDVAEPDTPAENDSAVEPEAPEKIEKVEKAEKPPTTEETWEQRYSSFKGLADAELHRMSEEVKRANARVELLEGKLAELAKKAETPPEPPMDVPSITPEDVDTYGKDLIDLQERVAKRVMADASKVFNAERGASAKRIAELEAKLASMQGDMQRHSAHSFTTSLAARVPSWEKVNTDPGFLAWLAHIDPLVGVSRQDLLNDAVSQENVDRVAAFFTSYMSAQPANPQTNNDAELNKQVSPARSSKATVTSDAPKIWTQAEISDFYNGVARGKVSADDAAKIENDINRAITEGRIK
jgi:hypothetical protein